MDARPEIPDPQHDRHVAFPDEPVSPPPDSWWEPTPPRPYPPAPPAPPMRQKRASRGRRAGAGWAIVAILISGGLMSHGDGETGMSNGPDEQGIFAEQQGSSSVKLDPSPAPSDGRLAPAESPLFAIPSGTLWFQLEVVGNDPRGTIDVTASSGSQATSGEVALPYAARLTRDNPDDSVSVTVHGAYGQRQVQCRVYVGKDLVAIGTGEGSATCDVPAWR